MITAKISSKGQIILPEPVRKALDVKPGQRVLFVIENGAVLLRSMAAGRVRALAGSLGRYARPSFEGNVRSEVQAEVARAAANEGKP